MARKLSSKQIRYLWAVGFFKRGAKGETTLNPGYKAGKQKQHDFIPMPRDLTHIINNVALEDFEKEVRELADHSLKNMKLGEPLGEGWTRLLKMRSMEKPPAQYGWYRNAAQRAIDGQLKRLAIARAELAVQEWSKIPITPGEENYPEWARYSAQNIQLRKDMGRQLYGPDHQPTKVTARGSLNHPEADNELEMGMSELGNFLDKRFVRDVEIPVTPLPAGGRDHYLSHTKSMAISLTTNRGTVQHEIGHFIEDQSYMRQMMTNDFLRKHGGTSTAELRDITGNPFYEVGEIAYDKPKVAAPIPYVFRKYNDGLTEVVSMGVQTFGLTPFTAAKLYPEFATVTLATLLFPDGWD